MDNKLKQIKINWFKVSAIYNSFSDKHLVSLFPAKVLNVIHLLGDECTQKKIVQMLNVPKQSVNNVIQDFIDDGYISLEINPKDKRSKIIKLTDKGNELYRTTIKNIEDAELRVLSNFDSEEISNYIKFSEKYNELLEKELEAL